MANIQINHPGSLRSCGYASKDSAEDRHAALNRAVKRFGLGETIKKINALVVLNKSRPNLHRIYKSDLSYLESKKK